MHSHFSQLFPTSQALTSLPQKSYRTFSKQTLPERAVVSSSAAFSYEKNHIATEKSVSQGHWKTRGKCQTVAGIVSTPLRGQHNWDKIVVLSGELFIIICHGHVCSLFVAFTSQVFDETTGKNTRCPMTFWSKFGKRRWGVVELVQKQIDQEKEQNRIQDENNSNALSTLN